MKSFLTMEKVDFPHQEKFPEDKEWEKWVVAQAPRWRKASMLSWALEREKNRENFFFFT